MRTSGQLPNGQQSGHRSIDKPVRYSSIRILQTRWVIETDPGILGRSKHSSSERFRNAASVPIINLQVASISSLDIRNAGKSRISHSPAYCSLSPFFGKQAPLQPPHLPLPQIPHPLHQFLFPAFPAERLSLDTLYLSVPAPSRKLNRTSN